LNGNDHGFQLSARLLSKNVIITTTIALQCVETQCGYHNFVENFLESGWPSSTLKLSDIDDDQTELNFICNFDILRIQPIGDNNPIQKYSKKVTMKQQANICWELTDDISPSYRTDNDDSSLILFYESPQFEDKSYVIHFIQSNITERDGFAVMLELFNYPQNVSKITLKWTVMVIYDGKIIKKSSTDCFQLNDSCHSKAFSKSDFHFIGESNVFSLSLLAIKLNIEILEIYDECNQIIPWNDKYSLRHWPKYGIFNEHYNDDMDIEHNENCLEMKMKKMDQKINKLLSLQQQPTNKNNVHRDDVYVENEDVMKFKMWLKVTVNLMEYYELFIQNGFDSLEMMKEINDVNDLNYIGIPLKAHQLKLMNHIKKLKSTY